MHDHRVSLPRDEGARPDHFRPEPVTVADLENLDVRHKRRILRDRGQFAEHGAVGPLHQRLGRRVQRRHLVDVIEWSSANVALCRPGCVVSSARSPPSKGTTCKCDCVGLALPRK